jgi:hypothetical protein
VKRLVIAIGWLALLAVPAAAQESGGGGDDLPPMMKNPRQLSGQARPEQTDPPRQLIVRLVQGPMQRREEFGDIVSEFPPGAVVHLVGVDARGSASIKSQKVDGGGRATFKDLAGDGSVSYYALALLPREGAVDRVESRAVMMPPEVGMRMILAGHGVKSGKPPADDVVGDDATGEDLPGPGEVSVELDGQTEGINAVELLQVGVQKPVARAKVSPSKLVVRPLGRVKSPVTDAALVDGTVDVQVQRRGDGVAGVAVAVVEAEGGAAVKDAKTDGEGRAVLTEVAGGGEKLKVRVVVHGRTLESPPFDPPAKGGVRIGVGVDWQEVESLRARFSGIAAGADRVYVARAVGAPRTTLSPPFQMTEARGATTQMIVFPGVLMAMHGGTSLDDDKLWFEVQFTVLNPAATPYDPGPGGLRIPLPKSYIGASVKEEMAARVKVDEDRGLVWRGAVPPGTKAFIATFALPTDGGKVDFDMPLPHGAIQSQLVLEDLPGMKLDLPAGIERDTRSQQGRKFVLLGGIERRPGEQLAFKIAGLPQAPAWRKWVRRGAGLAVLGLLGWALVAIVRGRRGKSREEELEAEREELLQALTQLEADLQRKKIAAPIYKKQKAALASRLEAVYAEMGAKREDAAGETSEAP